MSVAVVKINLEIVCLYMTNVYMNIKKKKKKKSQVGLSDISEKFPSSKSGNQIKYLEKNLIKKNVIAKDRKIILNKTCLQCYKYYAGKSKNWVDITHQHLSWPRS